jgi:hypothetical protein
MFNPICGSLRALQQASELDKVQKKLGCARASLGFLNQGLLCFLFHTVIQQKRPMPKVFVTIFLKNLSAAKGLMKNSALTEKSNVPRTPIATVNQSLESGRGTSQVQELFPVLTISCLTFKLIFPSIYII